MKCIVTGAAGFIGSSLCEKLFNKGFEVVGIDSFIDYYPRVLKEKNLENLKKSSNFAFIEGNLLNLDLAAIISDNDYIFHQAAQAGVRTSWGKNFYVYTENNIIATQQLLEACKGKNIAKIIAKAMEMHKTIKNPRLNEILNTDLETRKKTQELIDNKDF